MVGRPRLLATVPIQLMFDGQLRVLNISFLSRFCNLRMQRASERLNEYLLLRAFGLLSKISLQASVHADIIWNTNRKHDRASLRCGEI